VAVLGIDTATGIASVGVVVGQRRVERAQAVAGSHARALLPLIDAVLGDAGIGLADLTRIAVSIGPGSFTGLRIGVSVAKGLALATGLPVVGVPTLEAYARAIGSRVGLIWPILDARKGEIYAAGFRWRRDELETVMAAAALAPDDLVERLIQRPEACVLVGDGVDAHRQLWATLPPLVECISLLERPPSGAVVAQIGRGLEPVRLADLEPAYCRAAEAEVRRERHLAALSIG
jgi:tRNA threonylcarbamoyladenosine biosynthesis protein TsaB